MNDSLSNSIPDPVFRSTPDLFHTEESDYIEVVTASGLDGFEMNVINTKDTILPSTGGIGTTIFTVVGIAVMAGAVIALVVINKRNNK